VAALLANREAEFVETLVEKLRVGEPVLLVSRLRTKQGAERLEWAKA
jgi:hypothetical protein